MVSTLGFTYLCNLNCLITVEIPHFSSFITGSSKYFTPILKNKNKTKRLTGSMGKLSSVILF